MSELTVKTTTGAVGDNRHPPALYYVSVFELAERFSYFGMLSILIFYLYFPLDEGGLGLSTALASSLVGAYGGSIYFASILGGWLSDRVLGSARTLLLGAVLVLCGHLVLSLSPGLSGAVVGMVLIALGSGCTKPTTATIVGTLYSADSIQRVSGFTIFYLGINVGALTGGLATAFLNDMFGFHVGFAVAAAGMVIGLALYYPAQKRLPVETRKAPNPASTQSVTRVAVVALGAVLVLTVAFVTGILELSDSAKMVLALSSVAALTYFIGVGRSSKIDERERANTVRYLWIFGATVVQIALWMQLYGAFSVFVEQDVDRRIFGYDLPPASAVAGGALFAIVFTPVVTKVWRSMGERQPTTASKYAFAALLLGLSFAFIGSSAAVSYTMPILIVLLVVGVFYLADVIAQPAGLSYVTSAAPRAFGAQMTSVHLLAYAIGASLSGLVSSLYVPNENTIEYFGGLAVVAAALSVLLMVVRKRTALTQEQDQS